MPLAAGVSVVEYKGRRITHKQADRWYDAATQGGHTFLYALNDRYVIDGYVGGNAARWINHSCDPNCEALLDESDDGDPTKDRILIESRRRIRNGEELTYDYGVILDEPLTEALRRTWQCRCGAKRCRGTLFAKEGPSRRAASGRRYNRKR